MSILQAANVIAGIVTTTNGSSDLTLKTGNNSADSITIKADGTGIIGTPRTTANSMIFLDSAAKLPAVDGSALLNVPSVRQTVSFGPDTAGLPTFLPATSGSLTLTAQNISAGTPLQITAAQGNINNSISLTSNPVWSSLTASSTLYLYINASTGATGFTSLLPIYQFGGTPAVTNNQFTFNYGTMTGFMGNGTTAPATPIVIVGEAVTGASTTTAAGAYAYNGFYDSGFTAIFPNINTQVSKTSNLGVIDILSFLVIQCTSTDRGYAVGDQLTLGGTSGGSQGSIAMFNTRNTIGFGTNDTIALSLMLKGGGGGGGISIANWKYKLIAKRAW